MTLQRTNFNSDYYRCQYKNKLTVTNGWERNKWLYCYKMCRKIHQKRLYIIRIFSKIDTWYLKEWREMHEYLHNR